MGKHKHRNKGKKCCSGQKQHQCGGNCKCDADRVDKVEISTEAEMWALINLITRAGEAREKKQTSAEVHLANSMLADVESELPTVETETVA